MGRRLGAPGGKGGGIAHIQFVRCGQATRRSPQRALPLPCIGPSSNYANSVSDILDDPSEGLEPHWGNGM